MEYFVLESMVKKRITQEYSKIIAQAFSLKLCEEELRFEKDGIFFLYLYVDRNKPQ